MYHAPSPAAGFKRMSERLSPDVSFAVVFWIGVAALVAATIGSLIFLQSQCSAGAPFLPMIFPCFQ